MQFGISLSQILNPLTATPHPLHYTPLFIPDKLNANAACSVCVCVVVASVDNRANPT